MPLGYSKDFKVEFRAEPDGEWVDITHLFATGDAPQARLEFGDVEISLDYDANYRSVLAPGVDVGEDAEFKKLTFSR